MERYFNGMRTMQARFVQSNPGGTVVQGTLSVSRPAFGQANSSAELFRLTPDGKYAERVPVRLGRSSVNAVEILGGLQAGDRVIISDMSRYDGVDRVRLD